MFEQINLLVMPTDQCNMRCKYCFHGNSGYSKEIMDLEIFKKVILSIVDKWSRVQIVCHGGEPLCVPLEFYKEAYAFCESTDATFIYSLQTNATLLSQEKIDFFKDKHTKIGISYDGLTNDYVRGNTSKIVENIRKLKAKGIEPGAIMVVTKKNVNNLLTEYKHYKELGLSWKLNPLFIDGSATQNLQLGLDVDEYSEKLYELIKEWLYDRSCNINVQTCTDIVQLILTKKARVCTYNSCLGKWFCINHKGDIYPCDRLYNPDFKLASIKDIETFSQVYDSPCFHSMLCDAIKRRNYCKDTCDIFEHCYGGCNANAYLGNGIAFVNNDTCKIHRYLIKSVKKEIQTALKFSEERLNPRFVKLLHTAKSNDF